MSRKEKVIISWIVRIAILAAAIFFLTTCVRSVIVSGESMENTLHDGQMAVINKIEYKVSDPKRFDIIVFEPENNILNPATGEPSEYLVKRIIGLPGETVRIDKKGNIFINGTLLDEDYGKERIRNPGIAADSITLGGDEYFILGDNRNNSLDSRSDKVGLVKREDITGKVIPWTVSNSGGHIFSEKIVER